eukprot:TRINITY_DN5955_c0_g1_i1.p1 TRINITY_DN5955_c0_g1~~TRINITY_DN5955_c0_g1_i1.p1  ORF type:complete len:183 (-),score=8.22 TRINITY_DN5955_c0_g1_i1:20-568(-)
MRVFWIDPEIFDENNANWKEYFRFWYLMNNAREHIDELNGVFVFSDEKLEASYRGEYVNRKKCGRGIAKWKDQSYEGQWVNDQRNGFGTYRWDDGRRYVGLHEDDKRKSGKFEWPDGSSYRGEYESGARQGFGGSFKGSKTTSGSLSERASMRKIGSKTAWKNKTRKRTTDGEIVDNIPIAQ